MIKKLQVKIANFSENREIRRIEDTRVRRIKVEKEAERAKVEKAELARILKANKVKKERDRLKAKLARETVSNFNNKYHSLGDKYFEENNLQSHKDKKEGRYFA